MGSNAEAVRPASVFTNAALVASTPVGASTGTVSNPGKRIASSRPTISDTDSISLNDHGIETERTSRVPRLRGPSPAALGFGWALAGSGGRTGALVAAPEEVRPVYRRDGEPSPLPCPAA